MQEKPNSITCLLTLRTALASNLMMPLSSLRNIGTLSQRRSFLSEQNWSIYGDNWMKASFSVERCGDGPDAADLRLINAIVQTISETQSKHHLPGTLCIVTNGDKIYRHIIQLAKKQGWSVVVLSWGQLRGPLSKYIDAHHNLRAVA